MTVGELAEKLALTELSGCTEDSLCAEVCGCYIGDLLSWVMGRATEGDAWITVMGNINAVAVASLTGCACIILSEDAELDDDARSRSEDLEIPIFSSPRSSYRLAAEISNKCNL
ncbi:MAG: hypothetical protein IJP10_02620 [Clostridia bacterium]|nr:hypothetical protein [Oscillospiraceae bacterium]MBQ6796887.1 hypothetical protein [Clostridia bacterium]